MTTVTDSDIKELKDSLSRLNEKIDTEFKELNTRINEVDKKIIDISGQIGNTNTKIEALDKRLTESISSLDKRVSESFSSLDKRITTQEFIYRAVFIGIIATIATGVMRFLWVYPFNLS